MKSFLQELAEEIHRENPHLDSLTLVFPNRRAALYFRKHLSALLSKPSFAPKLITIEDFISGLSSLKVPDKLELIHRLYKTYYKIVRQTSSQEEGIEPFDQFYFWGDMLLRDFDEVDKYMVSAEQLFKDLSHQKELDASFDFLTMEQQDFLRSFWSNFDENQSANKRKFIQVWRQLSEVYKAFRLQLSEGGLAYEGMLHREVAANLEAGKIKVDSSERAIKFIGFNALTKAEDTILSTLVSQGAATIHWDMDAYYVNNNTQEAGKFFREYQDHAVLRKTFSGDMPANFLKVKSNDESKSTGKTPIRIFGAAQPVGQAKLMAQVLQEQLAKGISPEETLIVLPDEKLLLPVLHAVSGNVEKLNVTMGFPLSSTPMFNLIELLVELQINRKADHFNHKQVLALFGHPYVVAADAVASNSKRKEILSQNWVFIPKGFLSSVTPLHRALFQEVNTAASMISYLKEIITQIGTLTTIADLDKEYALHFLKFFNRLDEILNEEITLPIQSENIQEVDKKSLRSFLRLFRQLVRAQKIPFTGEPLKGLQVMGVLETRNLDFKNVFMLSLNEGALPSFGSKGSYIPYNIRKAYNLPTVEHQDAMYAYLFYRVLQRAENVFLFYNSETDVLGQGEMSRYLQQLLLESGLKVEKHVLHNTIQPRPINPIVIPKDEGVLQQLARLNEGNYRFKGMSPSALNSYIECRLKFYFRYVAGIKEANEVEEDLDARVLGNFLHDVMEQFYKRIHERKKSKNIEQGDFENFESTIDQLIDEVFIKSYKLDPGKKVVYEGQRLVVREMVKRFAVQIIEIDKKYTPFVMEALEQSGFIHTLRLNHSPGFAVIGGKIDRVDRKGNVWRIIDYKTGKDELGFESVDSLFNRDGKRNKAAFQTLLYALLYKKNLPTDAKTGDDIKLVPGLVNRMNVFDENFKFGLKKGKEYVDDVDPLLPEFEQNLSLVLNELFDPAISFDQTQDTETCKFCPYQGICYR